MFFGKRQNFVAKISLKFHTLCVETKKTWKLAIELLSSLVIFIKCRVIIIFCLFHFCGEPHERVTLMFVKQPITEDHNYGA